MAAHRPSSVGHAHQAGIRCILPAVSDDVLNYGPISGVMNNARDRGLVAAVSMHVGVGALMR